jgi:hypothetical protein
VAVHHIKGGIGALDVLVGLNIVLEEKRRSCSTACLRSCTKTPTFPKGNLSFLGLFQIVYGSSLSTQISQKNSQQRSVILSFPATTTYLHHQQAEKLEGVFELAKYPRLLG